MKFPFSCFRLTLVQVNITVFEREAVRREVIENGWEHHYALMYGDHADELAALCRNMDIELHLVK